MRQNCEYCGNGFEAKSADVARGFGRFCSRQCGWANQRKRGKSDAWRYFRESDGRWYRKWREPGCRKIRQQTEHRWMWEQAYGPIHDGYEIHHKNHDQADNRLDNFEIVTAAWHDDYHQRLRENHRTEPDGTVTRRCGRCSEYKPLAAFTIRRAGTYQGYCKPCAATGVREWKVAHRDEFNARRRERRQLGFNS